MGSRIPGSLWPRWVGVGAGVAIITMLFLATNESILNPYRFSEGGDRALHAKRSGGIPNRVGIYRTDYQGAARFVKERIRPGDGLVVAIPHAFFYRGMKPTYSLNTMLNQKVSYEGSREVPGFIDKNGGFPLLRSVSDLQYVQTRYARLWLVLVPSGNNDTQSADVQEYLEANQKVVFETYGAQVVLLEGAQGFATQK